MVGWFCHPTESDSDSVRFCQILLILSETIVVMMIRWLARTFLVWLLQQAAAFSREMTTILYQKHAKKIISPNAPHMKNLFRKSIIKFYYCKDICFFNLVGRTRGSTALNKDLLTTPDTLLHKIDGTESGSHTTPAPPVIHNWFLC